MGKEYKMKEKKTLVHLCCGDIYLKNFVNIDIKGTPPEDVFSEVLKINETTIEYYYKYSLSQHPNKNLCIADMIFDIRYITDFMKSNSVDYVLMLSAFEHFSQKEAIQLLQDVYIILKPKGKFHFNFPDIENSFKCMQHDRSVDNLNWHMRLIYGSHRNKYATHKYGYTEETIDYIFTYLTDYKDLKFETIVKTDYPMLGVTFIK